MILTATERQAWSGIGAATSGRQDPDPTQSTNLTLALGNEPPLPPVSPGSTEQVDTIVLRFTADEVVAMAVD